MAQFTCSICGEGFEQRSRLERHTTTSHPEQAVAADDILKALAGIEFPVSKEELVEYARSNDAEREAAVLEEFPKQQYRDGAEVSRAFGEIRAHESRPKHQPSKRGGAAAMESRSAAAIARLFEGIDFPVDTDDLQRYASKTAADDTMEIIEQFRERTFHDMAEVEKEFSLMQSN